VAEREAIIAQKVLMKHVDWDFYGREGSTTKIALPSRSNAGK
jgi:hypothetical protein